MNEQSIVELEQKSSMSEEDNLIIDTINKLRPVLQDCDENEAVDDIQYYPSDFGSPHNCGSVSYIWPQISTFLEHIVNNLP